MHTITTRASTPEEQQLIAGRAKPDLASYGCLTIAAIAPAYFLGALGGWLGRFLSRDAAVYGQWIGWFLAAVAFVLVLIWFSPHERRQRQRASKDQQAQIIQDIHVADPRVIEIGLINDNEPILAFDLGDNTILFLQGQWLRDSVTYGAEEPADDPDDKFINGLPAPHSFPSTEFTVSRFPNSGEVVGIRVSGRYLEPQSVVEALRLEYELNDSEVLEGPWMMWQASWPANTHAKSPANR